MAYTQNNYTGDGVTTDYQIDFPYIAQLHVKAYVNDVINTDWSFVGATLVRFNTPPGDGISIIIRRETPYEDRLVEFQNGAILSEADLNLAAKQVFYSVQEIWESELYLRGPQGYPGSDGSPGAPGADGADGTTPWPDLPALLADLFGQINQDHLDTLTRQRINYVDAIDTALGSSGFAYGATEDGILETLHQADRAHAGRITTAEIDIDAAEATIGLHAGRLTDLETEDGNIYTAIGVINVDLNAARGEMTTLGVVIQSGEYGKVAVGAISNGPFIDGESLSITGGKTAKYSIIGSTIAGPGDMVIYDASAQIVTGNTITGDTSGASCDATADYVHAGIVDDVRVLEVFASAADLQYTVKLEYNSSYGGNVIAGFGLFIDDQTATSDFVIFADNFVIVNQDSGGNTITPFIVSGSTVGINGSLLVKGAVGIDGNLLVNGSVKAEAIEADDIFTQSLYLGGSNFKLDGANKKIVVNDGTYDRVELGQYSAGVYGLRLKDSSGNITFEQSDTLKQEYMKLDRMDIVRMSRELTWPFSTTYDGAVWNGGTFNGEHFVGAHSNGNVYLGWVRPDLTVRAGYDMLTLWNSGGATLRTPGAMACWDATNQSIMAVAATTGGICFMNYGLAGTPAWKCSPVFCETEATYTHYYPSVSNAASSIYTYLWYIDQNNYLRCLYISRTTGTISYNNQVALVGSGRAIIGAFGANCWVRQTSTGATTQYLVNSTGGYSSSQSIGTVGQANYPAAVVSIGGDGVGASHYIALITDSSSGNITVTASYANTTRLASTTLHLPRDSGWLIPARDAMSTLYGGAGWTIPLCLSAQDSPHFNAATMKHVALGMMAFEVFTNQNLETIFQAIQY